MLTCQKEIPNTAGTVNYVFQNHNMVENQHPGSHKAAVEGQIITSSE